MSSRGSSKKSSSRSSSSSKVDAMTGSPQPLVSTTLIMLLYNLLVLGYIMNLEGKRCNCISDWRHDFIKYFSIAIIIWSLLTVAFNLKGSTNEFVMLLRGVIMFASLINLWCLYTYVGDLDKTQCKCAVEKQKDMHYFLYIWRYVLVGFLIFALLAVILATLVSM